MINIAEDKNEKEARKKEKEEEKREKEALVDSFYTK